MSASDNPQKPGFYGCSTSRCPSSSTFWPQASSAGAVKGAHTTTPRRWGLQNLWNYVQNVPSIFTFCGILGLLVDFLWSVACLPSAGLCQVGCNQSWLFSKMLFLTKHFGLRFTCWELNNLIPIQSKARARACHGEINGLGYRWEERRRRRGLNSPWGSRRLWCQKVAEPRTDVTRGMASVEEITENL